MVRIWGFHCHGPGSVPGQGAEILKAVQRSQIKKERLLTRGEGKKRPHSDPQEGCTPPSVWLARMAEPHLEPQTESHVIKGLGTWGSQDHQPSPGAQVEGDRVTFCPLGSPAPWGPPHLGPN